MRFYDNILKRLDISLAKLAKELNISKQKLHYRKKTNARLEEKEVLKIAKICFRKGMKKVEFEEILKKEFNQLEIELKNKLQNILKQVDKLKN
jgi:hypothetical protein